MWAPCVTVQYVTTHVGSTVHVRYSLQFLHWHLPRHLSAYIQAQYGHALLQDGEGLLPPGNEMRDKMKSLPFLPHAKHLANTHAYTIQTKLMWLYHMPWNKTLEIMLQSWKVQHDNHVVRYAASHWRNGYSIWNLSSVEWISELHNECLFNCHTTSCVPSSNIFIGMKIFLEFDNTESSHCGLIFSNAIHLCPTVWINLHCRCLHRYKYTDSAITFVIWQINLITKMRLGGGVG